MLTNQQVVLPNPACSGHGYAVGEPWGWLGKVNLPAKLKDGTAVPLTPSLGKGWQKQRRVEGRGESGSGKVKLVLGGGVAGKTISGELSRVVV